jgi:hypothetical protein
LTTSDYTEIFSGLTPGQVNDLIAAAIAAPSGHNTQPWKFTVSVDTITILPDYSRSLPVVDPNNRELFISLGCALENLTIAARVLGFSFTIALFPDSEKQEQIQVTLKKGVHLYDPLYSAISMRQSNRQVYTGEAIPEKDLILLGSGMPYEKVRLDVILRSSAKYNDLVELVTEADGEQMCDYHFKKELIQWIRFNKSEQRSQRDGLSHQVLGFPSFPRFLGSCIIKAFLRPGLQSRMNKQKLESSAAMVLFSASEDSKAAWVNVGRTFQRFSLESTLTGVALAHVNQPVEVPRTREKLRNVIGIPDYYPSLLIRLGYAGVVAKSPRRLVGAVLVRS